VIIGSGGDQGGATATTFENPADNRVVEKDCASTSASATDVVTVQPADIIFAIDGSSSMAVETEFVRQQMNRFSKKIMDSGVDVRVIVIAATSTGTGTGGATGSGGASARGGATGRGGSSAAPGGRAGASSVVGVAGGRGIVGGPVRVTTGICIDAPLGSGKCPADTNLPHYAHVEQAVASNDALNLFVSTYSQWKQYLRPEASKSLVVVTDDNATTSPNNNAATFTKNFTALDPQLLDKWTFNGVFCFTQCAEAAAIGTVYKDLVSQRNGVSGDLCEQNFEPVFNRLAEQIIQHSGSKLACEWQLPERSGNQTFSPTLVEVSREDANGQSKLSRVAASAQCGNGGWYFDSNLNPTKILACKDSCDDMQLKQSDKTTTGKVNITFGCERVGSCVANESAALSTGRCEWDIPKPPSGQDLVLSSVNVRYTSASGFATDLGKVDNTDACANVEEGWHYDDPSRPSKVVACPQTCTQIQAGGSDAKVEILFGCATAKAPPIINL
jgi:hypothetical protein